MIVDDKYNKCAPSVFCCQFRNPSPFWKRVIWACHAAKMSFRKHIGNDKKVSFWEDKWFGSCSFTIQYWELYSFVCEQDLTINEA
jgi:hypothetical protein